MAADRTTSKPEIASQKRVVKLGPALGDWTNYRPPKVLIKKVKTGLYGFDRLSKEELDAALTIHYRFVQQLLGRLKVDLGLGVEFFACQVEQTTYLNFLRQQSGPLVQAGLSIAGLHESVQLILAMEVANSVINHALGSKDIDSINRALTEAEAAVLTAALTEYLGLYTAAFEQAFPAPELALVSSPEPTLDQSINPASTFITFTADVALGDNPPGRLTFGYPGAALKSLLKSHAEKDRAKPLNFGRLAAAVLSRIKVPVKALLGRTTLFSSDLHSLESGDVVSLEAPISSAVTLSVGGRFKLQAQPGLFNRKKAVRIAAFSEEEAVAVAPPPVEAPAAGKPATPPPPAPAQPAPAVSREPVLEEDEEIFKEEDIFPEEEEEFSEEDLELEEFPEEEVEGEEKGV